MREYTIIPLPLGKILLDKNMMPYRMFMGEKIEIPYFSWLVKGSDKYIFLCQEISWAWKTKLYSVTMGAFSG